MAELTVCIEMDEAGKLSVGVKPPDGQGAPAAGGSGEAQAQQLMGDGEQEGAPQSYLRPVPSVDAALEVARQLLTQGQQSQGQQAEQQMGEGFGPKNPAMAA
jgi:hypothetical protein